jgi:exodeoxyribonuclease V alpha subunit
MLRDLLAHDYCPKVVLDQVVRQAGILKENCVGILRGKLADTTPGEAGTMRPWYVLKHCDSPDAVLSTLLTVVSTELDKIGLAEIDSWQVLTPYNKGAIGAQALNLHLQKLVQQKFFNVELPAVPAGSESRLPRPVFHIGDKVMQTRNNYTLDVMNGAQGIVRALHVSCLDEDGREYFAMAVDFGDSKSPQVVYIAEGSEDMSDIVLAYAVTVHKSQGSEYPCSIVICAKAHSYMLTQNLLYTAVTRARKTCVIIGDHIAMRRAVTTNTTFARRTWLATWGALHTDIVATGD